LQSHKLSQANSQLSIEESKTLLNFSFKERQRQSGLDRLWLIFNDREISIDIVLSAT